VEEVNRTLMILPRLPISSQTKRKRVDAVGVIFLKIATKCSPGELVSRDINAAATAAYLKPSTTKEGSKRRYDIPRDTTAWFDQQTAQTAKQPTPAAKTELIISAPYLIVAHKRIE